MTDTDPRCQKCGHPRSNHPYRHIFVGPSQLDTVEALTAKLAEADAMIEAQQKDYASNNLRFAEAEYRADLATPLDDPRVKALVEALRCMVYETTCLSPLEDDGSHWCKISKDALAQARAALEAIASPSISALEKNK